MISRVFVTPIAPLALAVVVASNAGSLASAAAGLANPAAEYCVAEGGFYGTVDGPVGQRGVCRLPDGTEVDAWDHFRQSVGGTGAVNAGVANPAASLCAALGGTYALGSSICSLPDGTEVNAWDLLRDAHGQSVSLANPAAVFCLAQGGSYEIRSGADGEFGICRMPDGTEIDAWTLFRDRN